MPGFVAVARVAQVEQLDSRSVWYWASGDS